MKAARIISVLALALAAAGPVWAQTYDPYYDNYPGIRRGWGIRASLDCTIPGNVRQPDADSFKLYKNGLGFSAGVVYSLPIGGSMFFQPGVSLFYDTYKYDDIAYSDPGDGGMYSIDPTVKKFGIRIPVVFGYSVDLWNRASLAFFTGPELSVGLVGRVSVGDLPEWGEAWPDNLYGEYNMRRVDCGWKIGAGVPMGDYYVGVEGVFGMCDLMKGDLSFRENRINVTLGYNF